MKEVKNNERAIVVKNNKIVDYLRPGKHRVKLFSEAKIFNIYASLNLSLEQCAQLFEFEAFVEDTIFNRVMDNQIAIVTKNGIVNDILPAGEYIFWKNEENVEVKVLTMDDNMFSFEAQEFVGFIPVKYFRTIVVDANEKGILKVNKQFRAILEPGIYYFWTYNNVIECECVDMRIKVFDMVGQEMLTKDKVTLRINFVCRYKIIDPLNIVSLVEDYQEQIYLNVQVALREYIGAHKLDEILENKQEIAELVLNKIKEVEKEYFIEFYSASIKDITLPGEIRDIMNTVLVAEKKAQANVITRREEVASTRSLLNTAKLMDENKTLYKLKELEYVERICDNVGNISLGTDSDVLSQITNILR